MNTSIRLSLVMFAFSFAAVASAAQSAVDTLPTWKKATTFLLKEQGVDGGWGKMRGRVGITALVLESLTMSPAALRKNNPELADSMARAAAYLASQQKADGSIHDPHASKNYCTSLTAMALAKYDAKKYAPVVAKAVKWIRDIQATRAKGYIPEKHLSYGGFGYGSSLRTDLSNTWIALDALKEAGVPKDDPVWKAALVFVQRCQNSTETNDKAAAANAQNDGGAQYLPNESPAKETVGRDGKKVPTSYGSMTYAMVLSYLWCNLKKDDSQVKLATKWLLRTWSVDKNPNTKKDGQQGLYYYYRVMAKSLDAYGEKTFGQHAWGKELAAAIIKRQAKDGAWRNPQDRWGEGDPALATGYCLTALALSEKNF